MDAGNSSLISLGAAPPAPPPADSLPPAARADGSAPSRSFAATLAHEQPCGEQGAGAAAAAAAPDPAPATDRGGAEANPDASAKDAKSATKPAAKPKTAARGDASPPDGNALPLWLPVAAAATPTTTAAAGTAPAAVAAASAAAGPDAVQTTPTQAAAQAADPLALAGPPQQQVASAAAVPAAAGPNAPSGPAGADAASLAAALAKSTASPPTAQSQGAAVPSSGAERPQQITADAAAAASAPPVLTVAPPPAPGLSATPAPAAVPVPVVVTMVAASAPKATRAAVAAAAADAARSDSQSTAATDVTAPVATELEHAVAAVLSADTKTEVAGASAAVKPAIDASAAVLPQTATPERTTATTVAQVATPVGAPDWAHELSDRVNVLVNQNLTHAQIKLSPADLGPIEVRIALADGQANISFATHSHLTSEALQAAVPKLREALVAQGYSSVNVDVAQQQFRERAPHQIRYEPEPAFAASAPPAVARGAARATSTPGATLRLDAYA